MSYHQRALRIHQRARDDEVRDPATAFEAACLTAVGLASEADTALDAALAENAALREALEPFSRIAGEMFAMNWERGRMVVALDSPDAPNRVYFDDFLRARLAISTPAPALEGSDWNKALEEAAFIAQEGESPVAGRVAAAIRGLKRGEQ